MRTISDVRSESSSRNVSRAATPPTGKPVGKDNEAQQNNPPQLGPAPAAVSVANTTSASDPAAKENPPQLAPDPAPAAVGVANTTSALDPAAKSGITSFVSQQEERLKKWRYSSEELLLVQQFIFESYS